MIFFFFENIVDNVFFFFFQAEDGIRDKLVTGVQTCALPIFTGHRDTSRGWMARHGLRPGKILWEVQEAYQPGVVREKLTRGPLEYAALWQVAQRMTDRPVKFGAICAPALAGMLWNEFYQDDKAMILDLC